MATLISVSDKAQFTLDKRLMEHLGLKAGDSVSVRQLPGQRLEIEAQHNRVSKADFLTFVDDQFKQLSPLSIEEMNAIIAQAGNIAGKEGLE